MDMDENAYEEFTKRENGLKQSPRNTNTEGIGRKKTNPVRKTEQNQSVVGKNQSKRHHRCKGIRCFKICTVHVLTSIKLCKIIQVNTVCGTLC